MDGFHVQDGLFFERRPDGAVVIVKINEDSNNVTMKIEVTAESWASIISSVSANGSNYYEALEFHNKK